MRIRISLFFTINAVPIQPIIVKLQYPLTLPCKGKRTRAVHEEKQYLKTSPAISSKLVSLVKSSNLRKWYLIEMKNDFVLLTKSMRLKPQGIAM